MVGASDSVKAGYIQEIFHSIQGEGLWAGRMQYFVRLKGCSVGCRFCDTPGAFFSRGDVQRDPGPPGFAERLSAAAVLEILEGEVRRTPGAHSFAITGGEPLEQVDFVESLVAAIKDAFGSKPILLETAGLHWKELRRVVNVVDLISMDYKLPSTSGLHGTGPEHERFLETLKGYRFSVKLIVDQRTPHREAIEAARAVSAVDREAPLFLQPVTREGRIWGGAYLLDLWRAVREVHRDVRVLPQIHKSLSLS